MEWTDRWALAVLDSLLHISVYHLYNFFSDAELKQLKQNKSKKHEVMSAFCGLSGMNAQKLECMHRP